MLLQIGEPITVSVGKDSSVPPSTGTLQLQDVLPVLLVQRALTGCLVLVQIYFKLAKELLLPPNHELLLFIFIWAVSTGGRVRPESGQVYEVLPILGSRLVMEEVA